MKKRILPSLLIVLALSGAYIARAYVTNSPSLSIPGFGSQPSSSLLLSSAILNTNSIANLPSAPTWPGQCMLWNSNGTLYAIISGAARGTWASTNKLAP